MLRKFYIFEDLTSTVREAFYIGMGPLERGNYPTFKIRRKTFPE